MTQAYAPSQVMTRFPAFLRPFIGQGPMVIGVRIVAAGLAFVAQVLASRLIGAEDFGRYALALVWLLILGHFATLGTNQLVCRYLSSYTVKGETDRALGLLYFVIMLSGGTSLLVATTGLLAVHSGFFDLPDVTVTLATMVLLFMPLLTLQDYLEAISRGLDKPLRGIAPSYLTRHVAVIIGIALVVVLGLDANAVVLLSFTLTGLVVTLVLQASLLHRSLRRALGKTSPVYNRKSWFWTALPMAGIDLTKLLFKNGDVLILGLFVAPELVATYFAATRISQILDYVPYSVTATTAQKYAAHHARGDRFRLQRLIAKASLANVVLSAIIALAIGLAAPWLLSLFGPSYGEGAQIVVILACGLVASALFGPGEDVLNMLGQERVCSFVHIVVLLVALALYLIFVPMFGIVAAACITSLALVLRDMLLAFFAYRNLGLLLPVGFGFASH